MTTPPWHQDGQEGPSVSRASRSMRVRDVTAGGGELQQPPFARPSVRNEKARNLSKWPFTFFFYSRRQEGLFRRQRGGNISGLDRSITLTTALSTDGASRAVLFLSFLLFRGLIAFISFFSIHHSFLSLYPFFLYTYTFFLFVEIFFQFHFPPSLSSFVYFFFSVFCNKKREGVKISREAANPPKNTNKKNPQKNSLPTYKRNFLTPFLIQEGKKCSPTRPFVYCFCRLPAFLTVSTAHSGKAPWLRVRKYFGSVSNISQHNNSLWESTFLDLIDQRVF